MKKIFIFLIIIILLLSFQISSFAINFQQSAESLWDSLDDNTQDYLKDIGIDEVSIEDLLEMTPYRAVKFLIKSVTDIGNTIFEKIVSIIIILIITAIILSYLDKSESSTKVVCFFATLAILSIIVYSLVRVLNDAIVSIKTSCVFVDSYLPIMCSIIIATKNPALATTYNSFTIFLSSVIVTIADKFLLPIISGLLGFNMMSAFSLEKYRDRVIKTIKRIVVVTISLFSTIYTGLLTTQSILASSSDSVMLKGIRFVSGTFIPIVGNGVSDALATVFSSFLIMKNTFGIFIIIAIVLINLPVMIELLIWYFVIGFCSITSSMLNLEDITDIFDSLSSIVAIINIIVFFVTFVLVISTGVILAIRG